MRGLCRWVQAALEDFHKDECAQDLIEYALLAALLALGAVVSMNSVSDVINNSLTVVHSKLHKHVGKHLGWSK